MAKNATKAATQATPHATKKTGARSGPKAARRVTGDDRQHTTRATTPLGTTAIGVAERVPPVPEGTDWTPEELAEVRTELAEEFSQLRAAYDRAMADLTTLQRTANDGAGDDQADAGTKTFEREQEMSIAHNRLDLLTQMERAVQRLDAGTYGRCESCADPIAKARMLAFPSATLCVTCKQREERR